MSERRVVSGFVISMALLTTSCASRTLVFTTYTNIGLDVSAANGSPTKAVFGYKRFEGAVIPVDPSKRTKNDGDAMSVFAAIDLKNEWLNGLSVLQIFATGQAAENAASNPEAFASMLQKFGPSNGATATRTSGSGATTPTPTSGSGAATPTPTSGSGTH